MPSDILVPDPYPQNTNKKALFKKIIEKYLLMSELFTINSVNDRNKWNISYDRHYFCKNVNISIIIEA